MVQLACIRGDLRYLNQMLEDNPSLNPAYQDNLALRTACKKGHLEIVERLLLDLRVDPSALNNMALNFAINRNNMGIIARLLRDTRVDVHQGYTWFVQHCGGIGSDKISLPIFRLFFDDPRMGISYKGQVVCNSPNLRTNIEVIEILLSHPATDPAILRELCYKNRYETNHNALVLRRLLLDDRVVPSLDTDFTKYVGWVDHWDHLDVYLVGGFSYSGRYRFPNKVRNILNDMLRENKTQISNICLSLTELPALQLVMIIDEACSMARHIPLHIKWKMVTTIKHYHSNLKIDL